MVNGLVMITSPFNINNVPSIIFHSSSSFCYVILTWLHCFLTYLLSYKKTAFLDSHNISKLFCLCNFLSASKGTLEDD